MTKQLTADGNIVNNDGTITLYHTTSPENAKKINEQEFFKPAPAAIGGGLGGQEYGDCVFFGTDKNWVKDNFRSAENDPILEVRVPVEYIRKGAQNKLEVYFEGGLKKVGNIWVPAQPPQSTFYDRSAVKRYLKNKFRSAP
jgi:hypothetical protein